MFEQYTEKARRVIFFARYEASQFGSPHIETEHLLLGLLREDKALTSRFLGQHSSGDSIREQIETHVTIREKFSTSVDLPLSNECKHVLAYASEEAERLSHKHIGTEHLLLGLLREEQCFAAEILAGRGLNLTAVREEIVHPPSEASKKVPTVPTLPPDLAFPPEIREIMEKVKLIVKRMEEAILAGDLDTARQCLFDERKERKNLRESLRLRREKRNLK